MSGQLVTRIYLDEAIEVHLAVPDGPAVRFEPAAAPESKPSAITAAEAMLPPAEGKLLPAPAPAHPGSPETPATGPAGAPAGGRVIGGLRMLMPVCTWLRDPAMRQWQRLLVAAYALTPPIMIIVLQRTTSLVTLGWVYCLYIVPLWVLVFWFLIRPGPITRLPVTIGAAIVAAEFVLIPVLTLPWEHALAPTDADHSLLGWIVGVGLPEELTKALPVMVLAIVLLRARHIKLDVRMWMFLATLSGLFFGAYEASQVYVPAAIVRIAHGSAFGIPLFAERVFVDGMQHAVWAGIAGFLIGLGANYHRQRILLWTLGIAVPSVLHGLNDWVLTWSYAVTEWLWIAVQVLSLFLFLGYTASAASIERQVRHTPIFRGESIYLDPSRQQKPPSLSGQGRGRGQLPLTCAACAWPSCTKPTGDGG